MGEKFDPIKEPADRSCDTKTWQGTCAHEEHTDKADKYLCSSCGKIHDLDHEMHHEHFPHLCGDESMLH